MHNAHKTSTIKMDTDWAKPSFTCFPPTILLNYWTFPIKHLQNVNYVDGYRLRKTWFHPLSPNHSSQLMGLLHCTATPLCCLPSHHLTPALLSLWDKHNSSHFLHHKHTLKMATTMSCQNTESASTHKVAKPQKPNLPMKTKGQESFKNTAVS
jgi:hypothetical protein